MVKSVKDEGLEYLFLSCECWRRLC